MSMTPEMDARLRMAAEAEAAAQQKVLDLVVDAADAGGTLREIGAAIGRSHTQVGRLLEAARTQAASGSS